MGLGDVKMMAMLGATLGWQPLLPLMVMASVSGALIGIVVAMKSRHGMQVALPFGVFLGLAFLVTHLLRQRSVGDLVPHAVDRVRRQDQRSSEDSDAALRGSNPTPTQSPTLTRGAKRCRPYGALTSGALAFSRLNVQPSRLRAGEVGRLRESPLLRDAH